MENTEGYTDGYAPPPSAPALPPAITPEDKALLDQAQNNKQLLHALAGKAVAESETASAQLEILVLKLYRKYGLADTDAFHPDGRILVGGARQR
jgi:hypothetical protein